jgi:hypothetical protein
VSNSQRAVQSSGGGKAGHPQSAGGECGEPATRLKHMAAVGFVAARAGAVAAHARSVAAQRVKARAVDFGSGGGAVAGIYSGSALRTRPDMPVRLATDALLRAAYDAGVRMHGNRLVIGWLVWRLCNCRNVSSGRKTTFEHTSEHLVV